MTGLPLSLPLRLPSMRSPGLLAPLALAALTTAALSPASPLNATSFPADDAAATVNTDTLYAVWTVHVDPGPPWTAPGAYEDGCEILDKMATVFESHGISLHVAVSWNFNSACQSNFPTNVLPGSVTDLASRGHDIGVHEHQGASFQTQVDGLTLLSGFAPVIVDGMADYDQLVSLGFTVGAGPGKDVSTQLTPLSTRSYRADRNDFYLEDPGAPLLAFLGGSFDGQSFEPDETDNMTSALLYDISRMVPGKLHSWTVVTHPDEYVKLIASGQLDAAMASLDQWLSDDIDPLIADGSVTWTTKRAFEQTYSQWEAEGGDNSDLFPATLQVRKPGWSSWTMSDTVVVNDRLAGLDVSSVGDISVGSGTITNGGLSRLANSAGAPGDALDPTAWTLFQSNPMTMLSDKPLFLFSDGADRLWATMATEPSLSGTLGISRWDGVSWTNFPSLTMGFSGGSPGFLWEAALDNAGFLWVGTGQGVARLSGSGWSFFTPNNGAPSPGTMPLSHKRIYRVAVAPDGRKWFGTLGGGVDILDDNGTANQMDDAWQHFDQPDLPSGAVRSLAFDGAGNTWVGTQRGAAYYDAMPGTWTLFDENTSGLIHDQVTALLVDARGDVWFGSYGHGVSRYRPSTGLWDSYTATGGEMLASYIFDIAEDSAGRLLFSGYQGGGVAVFDQQLSYDVPPTLGQPFVLTVAGTPGENVLLLVSANSADVQSAAWGTLLVDPTSAVQIALGAIPASGELTVSFPIPFDPSLLGTPPIYCQAFSYSSLGPAVGQFTNRQSFVFVP